MSLQADIKKSFPGFSLDVSLSTEGGILGILGASGSGKSMALKCIAGIMTPDKGRIVLNGRVLFDSEKKINLPPQKRRVGYLFQNYALFPNMTVEENIAAGLRGTKEERKAVVGDMVALFKLSGLEKRYPSQLSGGQQQRTALARILAYEPDVIMLDEPFSALDFYLKEQLQLQVREVMKSYRGDALLVTHSRDEVYRFCENGVILSHGHVAMAGPTKTIFRQPDNVTAARLTGCKNISRVRRISSHKVLALDWGFCLETAQEVGDDIEFIGIRAHQFYPARGGVNEFTCRWIETMEEPFELDVLLKPVGEAAENDACPRGTENGREAEAVRRTKNCREPEVLQKVGTSAVPEIMQRTGTAPARMSDIWRPTEGAEPIWWKLEAGRLKEPENNWLTRMQPGDIVRIGIAPEDVLLLKDI